MLTKNSRYDFSGNVDSGQVKLNWSWSVVQCSFVVGDSAPGPSWWAWWWQSVSSTRPCHSEGRESSQPLSLGRPQTHPSKPRQADARKDSLWTNSASFPPVMLRKSERLKNQLRHTLAAMAEGPFSTGPVPPATWSVDSTRSFSLSFTTPLSSLKKDSVLTLGSGC